MTQQEYIFKVREVVRVIDGDTYDLRVSPGFHAELTIRVRLLGFDCPERTKGSDFEKAEAKRAAAATNEWFLGSGPLWVRTEKDPDDFGRWLGEIWREFASDGRDHLGDYLRSQRLASVWPTRWRNEFDGKAVGS